MRRALRWSLAAASVSGVASDCTTDAACSATCEEAADEGSTCESMQCDRLYRRCACSVDHALLSSGGCEGPPTSEIGTCEHDYYAEIVLNLLPSPELRPQDILDGSPSPSLLTILRRCLAAAFGVEPARIVTETATMRRSPDAVGAPPDLNDTLVLLQADLEIDFCIGGGDTQPQSYSQIFDRNFREEADRYAALETGSSSVLSLERRGVSTTTAVRDAVSLTTPPPVSTPDESGGGELDVEVRVGSLWWVFLLVALLVILIASAVVWKILRVKRRKAWLALLGFPPDMAPFGPLPQRMPRAVALHAFVPERGAGYETCLQITEGDELDVHANCGEWLYGQRVGVEQMGYFPENHVSWVGRPVSDEPEAQMVGARIVDMAALHRELETVDTTLAAVEPPGFVRSEEEDMAVVGRPVSGNSGKQNQKMPLAIAADDELAFCRPSTPPPDIVVGSRPGSRPGTAGSLRDIGACRGESCFSFNAQFKKDPDAPVSAAETPRSAPSFGGTPRAAAGASAIGTSSSGPVLQNAPSFG